jgi:uncharacterized membrane protein YcaP (DUF421 family)
VTSTSKAAPGAAFFFASGRLRPSNEGLAAVLSSRTRPWKDKAWTDKTWRPAMDKLFSVEWSALLLPTHSAAEMMVRGTLMYLSLFLILRFIMLRQSSTIAIADILVIVVIADAAQNAFAKEYQSITEGLVLVLTVVFWDIALNWLGYRFRIFARLLAPPPMELVRDGKMNRRNMRREFINEEELRSQVRQQGVSDLAEVKIACLEANGEISVVRHDDGEAEGRKRKKRVS